MCVILFVITSMILIGGFLAAIGNCEMGGNMRRCYRLLFVLVFTLLGWGAGLFAQTGITGDAVISLIDGGETCNGMGRLVEVHVNMSGFLGTNNELAGLNSFVLAFTLDSPDSFASALPGDLPEMDWNLVTTQRSLLTTQLTLVGWVADMDPYNQTYHVATILFSGIQGSSGMSLDHAGSSLGSRVANGDGPGPISVDASPVSFSVVIPATFSLDIQTGSSRWLQEDMDYALVNGPNGPINVLDLVQLVNCGAE